jgi:RNA polymerase sigma-70 factor (ECF subfamily)
MQKHWDKNLACHLDGLYRYASVLARSPVEAAGLVQDTYVIALRSKGPRVGSDVKSWLFNLLRHAWIRGLPQPAAEPAAVESAEATDRTAHATFEASTGPQAPCVSEVHLDQLCDAVQQLPVEFREIIVLREYEELSYQEIGRVVDCSPVTVMTLLVRARSNLRTLLSVPLRHSKRPEHEPSRPYAVVRHQHSQLPE